MQVITSLKLCPQMETERPQFACKLTFGLFKYKSVLTQLW
uniref:Uncharacterized protein n=1 Tax=Rhizophora mucronata TaxID=61149 RepID=A0A2P2QCH6_RHIMU